MKAETDKAEPAAEAMAGAPQAPEPKPPLRRPRLATGRPGVPLARTGDIVQLGARPMRTPPFVVDLPAVRAPAIDADEADSRLPRPIVRRTPQRLKPKRRWGAILSFLLFVAIPTAIAFVYFGYYAANQYVVTTKYAIRSQVSSSDMQSRGGGAGALLSFGNIGIPAIADTFIVSDYIHSDQLLKDIEDQIDLRRIYSYAGADWYYRLDPTVSDEALLDYWTSVIDVNFDITTGISTLTVRAFTPEDAKRVGEIVLAASEKLVNDLSDRAQGDLLALAQSQVGQSKKRLDQALEAEADYQRRQKQISATGLAKSREEIEATIEAKKAEVEAQLSSLRAELDENAPTITLLKNQIASLDAQLRVEKARSAATSADAPAVSAVMLDFSKLAVEKEFAAKAYTSALSSLEGAQSEAAKQNRYLVAFVRPHLPDDTLFPNRPYMIGAVLIIGAMAWLFAMLITAVIREHV